MSTIRVVIDIREDDLWRELEPFHTGTPSAAAEKWQTEKKALDVGDIAFYAGDDLSGAKPLVVLERKTAEDLGASQKDGRYREQRARLYALRGAGTAIAYIVESPPWSPTLSRSWCRGDFTEVNLQQAMVRLQLRYTIPIFQATTVRETVQWIRRIAKTLVADPTSFQGGVATTRDAVAAAYTESIHVKKASNNTPERIFLSMLLSIPGIGKAAADAVSTATASSFTALLALSEVQIGDIVAGKRKIGKAVAAAIYSALHS